MGVLPTFVTVLLRLLLLGCLLKVRAGIPQDSVSLLTGHTLPPSLLVPMHLNSPPLQTYSVMISKLICLHNRLGS